MRWIYVDDWDKGLREALERLIASTRHELVLKYP